MGRLAAVSVLFRHSVSQDIFLAVNPVEPTDLTCDASGFQYGRISRSPQISRLTAEDAGDCCVACDDEPLCSHFVYFHLTKACELKHGKQDWVTPSEVGYVLSGEPAIPLFRAAAALSDRGVCHTSTYHRGRGTIGGSKLKEVTVPSEDDCCAACTSLASCGFWTFTPDQKTCRLKAGAVTFWDDPQAQSYTSGTSFSPPSGVCDPSGYIQGRGTQGGKKLRELNVEVAGECCAACDEDAQCTHWTFRPDTISCELKKGAVTWWNDPQAQSFTSGTSFAPPSGACDPRGYQQGRGTQGGTIIRELNVDVAGECCSACDENARCTYWTFDPDHTTCKLKNGAVTWWDDPQAQSFTSGHPSPTPPPATYPKFNSVADVQGVWGTYFTSVYGEIPTTGYPIHLEDFWYFYDDLLDATAGMPDIVGDCPASQKHCRYTENSLYQSPSCSWVWHPPPYTAFVSNEWVEVQHEADPWGDEHHGAWMMYAKGTGIWYNLGTTIAFDDHEQACDKFTPGTCDNEQFSMSATQAGFNSIQFLAHVDGVQYPCDAKHTLGVGPKYLNIEILCTSCVGTFACMGEHGAPTSVRRGWMGPLDAEPRQECKCDNTADRLNCNA